MPPALLPLVLAPAFALGQTGAVLHSDPSRGATLPPSSAALAADATASALNPGALSFLGGPELFYLHERGGARGQVVDGLFLGDSLFGAIGAGFSLEWVRGAGPDYRKTSYAFSVGSSTLSVGGSYNLFSSGEDADLDGLDSVDLGLAGRPSRYFSFGLVARNVGAPRSGELSLGRQFDVAVGLRPIGERYTLGADYLFGETAIGAGRLTYTARAEVLRGLWLSAGVSHGLRATDELFFQAALTVDSSHLGLTYAGSGAPAGANHLVGVRLSAQKYRAVNLAPAKVALLDLEELLADAPSPAAAIFGGEREDPHLRLLRLLDDAANDPDLKAVVLKVQALEGGLGKAEELRAAMAHLKARGKKVAAVLLTAADAEYLIACEADRIYAVPESTLLIDGLAATATFLGGSMEKLGVQWDVARVGAYKNAPDALTRKEMSPEQREATEATLDVNYRAYLAAIAKARSLTLEQVRAAIDEGLKTPRRAVQLGLVDEVIDPASLEDKLKELVPLARFEARYRPRQMREDRWGRRRQLAIVPVIGNIAGGKSREDPLGLSQIAGAETVVKALRRAAEDPDVAAIVVRVDSGGGDGLASDLIYRAVLDAKKKKPVVASMGDVAASGGYYSAMGADLVFAEPTTITGSIGVFMLKPAVEKLAERLGIYQEQLRRGERAGMLGAFKPWTEAERASAQAWIDAFYDDFITEVARSRKLGKEQVDALARGRVWAGEDAKARGLIDQIGGLHDALAAARKRAGVPEGEELELEVISENRGLFGGADGDGLLSQLSARSEPPEPLKRIARELGLERMLLGVPRPLAMMEYQLTVR
ncbi:MAG: signal peptide peptidase SppA [Myxococcales bacterium]|nr:signal peptide peptidase SppA [Myxococcales bacterium]